MKIIQRNDIGDEGVFLDAIVRKVLSEEGQLRRGLNDKNGQPRRDLGERDQLNLG